MDLALIPAPTSQEAVQHLDQAKWRAAVALDHIVTVLHTKALDPGASVTNLISMAEHMYKVSGMASKQQAQAANPVRVTFNFNAGSKGPTGVTIDQTPEVEPLPLDGPSSLAVGLFPMSDDLVCVTDE